jgi:aldehyde:ferredoxin oxidoreductase
VRGFHNKVLHIDLSQRSFEEQSIDDAIYREFLGGKGLATHLLLKNTKAGLKALSPENVVILATGPVTDTRTYGSCRYGVFTKSPLTGIYCESYAGGRVAEPLSRTGYDAIIIKGASQEPVYLEISPQKVIFHDSSHLWGKDTYETEDAIREEVGRRDAGIATIGPAGENLVKFALIENDRWRSAGRAGTGAVLGAKKVKGIACYGDVRRQIAHPEMASALWEEMRQSCKTDPGAEKFYNEGTVQIVPVTNKAGAFPTKYWTSGTFDEWPNLTMQKAREQCDVKSRACPKCCLACAKLFEVTTGRHKGLVVEGPEYETIAVFGGLCMISDIREVAYLNDICDRLGIDTITAGNVAAFTIAASQQKPIGEKIEYGDVDGISELLHKITRREGIGAVLAEGVRHAAKEWGLEDLAVHVKGLEPPGYEPRVLKGMGLTYATGDRGADHLRATFYKAELSGMVHPDQIEGKAEMLIDFEDRHTLFDALILCRFFRDMYSWPRLSLVIEATTGMKLDKPELQKIALDITNQAREFNLREGMTAADDTLPKRFFEERLEDSGKVLLKSDFDRMLADYYRIKGWDKVPPSSSPG